MFGLPFRDMRGGGPRRVFEEQYHCFPGAFAEKQGLEEGDKILMPASALDALARLDVEYPMLFQLTNMQNNAVTHCGVLEFSAPEGTCYLPYWMMSNLMLPEGGLIQVKNVSLPKASFVKFQPQHVDFLDINNPRAVLEFTMRRFSCVTKGDQLCIPYNSKKYYLEVKEVKPADAACIIECDCKVDFDAPVGYVEPQRPSPSSGLGAESAPMPNLPERQRAKSGDADKAAEFQAFTGNAQRIDGKQLKPAQAKVVEEAGAVVSPSKNLADEKAVWTGSAAGRQLNTGGRVQVSEAERRTAEREKRLSAITARSSQGGSSSSKGRVTKWSKTNKLSNFQGSGNRLS